MAVLIENPEQARRLARAIVSDISLYNQKKVVEGIKNDNLFEILKDEIQEGRDLYLSRVSPEFVKKSAFYEYALVDVLIKPSRKIESKIW